MPRENRAKQFAPFNALKGFQEALRMKEYEHDKTLKKDLSEDQILKISSTILNMSKNDYAKIKFFVDGYYKELTSKVKVDFENKVLNIENYNISFDDIFDIELVKNIKIFY